MMLTAVFVFSYYTVWAILLVRKTTTIGYLSIELICIQPFFDNDNVIHTYFPPREWAIRLPAFLFIVGLAFVGSFIGLTIVKENKKKAQKARLRTA